MVAQFALSHSINLILWFIFLGTAFQWSADDVQTARILFYLRVIPTCIEQLPSDVFRKFVVPTMFLYPTQL